MTDLEKMHVPILIGKWSISVICKELIQIHYTKEKLKEWQPIIWRGISKNK